jgi:hypothetical protein
MSVQDNTHDWCVQHANAAATQGWCLSEVDANNTTHSMEIQRIDDAETTGVHWGIQIPQLDDDDQAVQAMQAAWKRGEPHAELAYEILKKFSPSEFEFWGMIDWCRN